MNPAAAPPDISVIIAVYNAATTLASCVRSIQSQAEVTVEIILSDDASNDNSLQIAEALAAEDGRIRILRRDVNGGPGAARNAGLAAATGDWIAIVDADDTIAPGRLAAMRAAGLAHQADIVFDNLVSSFNGRPAELYIPASANVFGALPASRYIDTHLSSQSLPVFGFLKPVFRRRFVVENSVRYDEALRIGEDTLFVLNLFAAGGRAWLLPDAWYRYKRQAGSVSRVFDAGKALAYEQAVAAFMDGAGRQLDKPGRASLRMLVEYSRRRLAAKRLADRLTARNFLATTLAACRMRGVFPLFRHYLYVEARTRLGRALRAMKPA